MNPQPPFPPHDDLEARITALLLGELPETEAAALRREIAASTDLQKLHDELARTIGLVREARGTADEKAGPSAEPLTLSSDKRNRLLAAFKTVPLPVTGKKRRLVIPWREAASVAAMLALLAGVTTLVMNRGILPEDRLNSEQKPRSDGAPNPATSPTILSIRPAMDDSMAVKELAGSIAPAAKGATLDGRVQISGQIGLATTDEEFKKSYGAVLKNPIQRPSSPDSSRGVVPAQRALSSLAAASAKPAASTSAPQPESEGKPPARYGFDLASGRPASTAPVPDAVSRKLDNAEEEALRRLKADPDDAEANAAMTRASQARYDAASAKQEAMAQRSISEISSSWTPRLAAPAMPAPVPVLGELPVAGRFFRSSGGTAPSDGRAQEVAADKASDHILPDAAGTTASGGLGGGGGGIGGGGGGGGGGGRNLGGRGPSPQFFGGIVDQPAPASAAPATPMPAEQPAPSPTPTPSPVPPVQALDWFERSVAEADRPARAPVQFGDRMETAQRAQNEPWEFRSKLSGESKLPATTSYFATDKDSSELNPSPMPPAYRRNEPALEQKIVADTGLSSGEKEVEQLAGEVVLNSLSVIRQRVDRFATEPDMSGLVAFDALSVNGRADGGVNRFVDANGARGTVAKAKEDRAGAGVETEALGLVQIADGTADKKSESQVQLNYTPAPKEVRDEVMRESLAGRVVTAAVAEDFVSLAQPELSIEARYKEVAEVNAPAGKTDTKPQSLARLDKLADLDAVPAGNNRGLGRRNNIALPSLQTDDLGAIVAGKPAQAASQPVALEKKLREEVATRGRQLVASGISPGQGTGPTALAEVRRGPVGRVPSPGAVMATNVVRLAEIELRRTPAAKAEDAPAPRKPAPNAAVPQPDTATADNAFSTFSLNVSDVSFKLAAASLEKGVMPDVSTIRSEEFINAFDYRDPVPAPGVPIAFASERARYPFAHDRDLVRFSVKTAAVGRQPGKPFNIVLAIDNSGSMERADRIRIREECLRVLASQLQPQDRVSVVAFARTARLWVDGLPGNQAGELPQRVGSLTPEGGTNLEDAMNLAYQTALRHFLANGVNRVVLLTDGAANLGDVEPDSLKKKVEANRKQGIALDCFGIGWDGLNDELLEALSRNGDGRYGFVNTPEAATTEFAGQLAGALKVAASDVKVQVEWNPRRVTAYRQIGYAKHQLKKEQFRDNTVDAAEIGAAEAGNALYTVQVNPAGEGPLGTMRVRFKVPGTSDYREHEWPLPYEGAAKSLDQSSATLRLAASASAFSEWLVSSPFAAEVTPDKLLGYLGNVPEAFSADPRPKKLEWMIRQARNVSGK